MLNCIRCQYVQLTAFSGSVCCYPNRKENIAATMDGTPLNCPLNNYKEIKKEENKQ